MKVLQEASFKATLFTLEVDVRSASMPEVFDITDGVQKFVEQSQVRNGFVVVFSKHTTAAIVIQEKEPLLMHDMASAIERFAPRNQHYRHNDFEVRTVHMHEDECPNGHSHCQHLLLGASENVPLVDGKMTLGEFQRIFMVELDDQKDFRQILVQVMGT